MELAVLERLKTMSQFFSIDIKLVLLKLASNNDMHKFLNVFECRPDPTTNCGVSCS